MNARALRVAFLGLAGLLAGLRSSGATEAAPSSAVIAGAPGMTAAVYGFFDSRTGARTGRLRIEKVEMEYRHRGFMRVAWRPLVVLTGVDFDIGADLAWPSQGSQIAGTLRSLGKGGELVLRNVRLHLAGPAAREITARTARLLPGGMLELLEAREPVAGGAPAARPADTFTLALTGPNAGRLTRIVPFHGRTDRKISSADNPPTAS